MEEVQFELHPLLEDDIEVIELIEQGVPRQIYNRFNYFESMDDASFFKRFRLSRHTVLHLLEQIEMQLEHPIDK